MKFGIFYELQLPRPWLPGGELQLYQNALDQVELADRLGYDFAWEVEHHFLEEYSHSPAPEVFLAAASQRTQRIRLAHGIMQLTTTHPARSAASASSSFPMRASRSLSLRLSGSSQPRSSDRSKRRGSRRLPSSSGLPPSRRHCSPPRRRTSVGSSPR